MKTLSFLLLTILSLSVFAQNDFIEWKQCIDGNGDDGPYHIINTNTGTMICGTTTSDDGTATNYHGNEYADAWIISLDTLGNVLWERCYGGTDSDAGRYILKVENEDAYYIVGLSCSNDGDITYNPYPGVGSLMVIKIDSQGNIIWDKIFGSGHNFTYGITASSTFDGGLIIGAQITSSGGVVTEYFGDYDAWILKVDANGEKEWDKTLGSETDEEFVDVITPLRNGGYLIGINGSPQGAGIGNIECITFPSCQGDVILILLDASGKIVWERCLVGSENDSVQDIIELDDGFLLSTSTSSQDGDFENCGFHGEKDISIIKTDTKGNILWNKCYGGTRYDSSRKIFLNQDNEIYVVGQTGSNNYDVSGNHQESQYSDAEDIWVLKIGLDHEIIYQKCFGSFFDEEIYYGVTFDRDNRVTIAAQFHYNNGDIDCEHQPIIGGEINYGIWAISVLDTTVNNTAIEEFEHGFEIYPNPANHQLTIKMPENTNFQSVSNTVENNILVFNSMGDLVGEFPIKDQITINTTGYPSGLYFLQCAIGDDLITDKVMILHE